MTAIRNAKERRGHGRQRGSRRRTRCFGWKGRISTSSRVAEAPRRHYTVGDAGADNFGWPSPDGQRTSRAGVRGNCSAAANGDGSCMIVVATTRHDREGSQAPGRARGLPDWRRQARRTVTFARRFRHRDLAAASAESSRRDRGLADLALEAPTPMSPLFDMALETTEEAVYNSLLQATTVESKFGTAQAYRSGRLKQLLATVGASCSPAKWPVNRIAFTTARRLRMRTACHRSHGSLRTVSS